MSSDSVPNAFDRRDFLKSTGAIAAATLASSGFPALAAAPPEKKFKKALKYSMVDVKGPLVETFKMLKEIGYEGIDMDRPADRAEVRQAQAESGLIVHGVVDYVHWQQPLSSGDPAARAAYDALPPSHRAEYARWIGEGKRPETRAEHTAKTIRRLTARG